MIDRLNRTGSYTVRELNMPEVVVGHFTPTDDGAYNVFETTEGHKLELSGDGRVITIVQQNSVKHDFGPATTTFSFIDKPGFSFIPGKGGEIALELTGLTEATYQRNDNIPILPSHMVLFSLR